MLRIIVRALGIVIVIVVVAIAVQTARQAQAAAEVERAWQATPVQKLGSLGSTQSLTIVPLVDEASTRADLPFEHGVSYLVKTDRHTVLFDLGMNAANAAPSPLQHNMQALGVDLADVEAIVFSHVHPDHVGGLRWWLKDTFALGASQEDLGARPVYAPASLAYPGASPVVTDQPTRITDAVATTGAIAFADILPLALWRPLRTEQALVVNVAGQGIVLIVGCGHPTVERLVARAQATFDAPVVGIVGGLHYENKTAAEVSQSIAFLTTLQPRLVAVSPHDSTAANIQAFREAFPGVYQDIAVGATITLGR